jgi:uncharacterized protein YecT (DUF1311 family)
MMRRTVARLALALAFIAAAAHAQTLRDDIIDAATAEYKRIVHDCQEVVPCLRSKVQEASEGLATTYRSVEKSLRSNPKQSADLSASQEAWSKFVKANCEFLGSMTKDPAEYQLCMLHYIETRALELHTYIGWDR